MNFFNASLRGPQTPSAETGSYAYGNATGSPLETHAPDGVGRFHRRAQRHAARAAARTASSDFQWGLCPQAPVLKKAYHFSGTPFRLFLVLNYQIADYRKKLLRVSPNNHKLLLCS